MKRLLGVLSVVLLLVAVALGFLALGARSDRAGAALSQERYGEVLTAAREHAGLLVTLRYDDPAVLEQLAAGSTERLAERYSSPDSPLVRAIEDEESVSDGSVAAAGVVDLTSTTATVLVATEATVTSRATDGEAEVRDLRLRIELVRDGDAWLVDDIEVVR